jgi:hypothetical protein
MTPRRHRLRDTGSAPPLRNTHAQTTTMPTRPTILFRRRTDLAGLERLTLSVSGDAVPAESTVPRTEDDGFRLDHRLTLTSPRRLAGRYPHGC